MEKPLHHFDKRIVRRSIRKALLSEEDLSAHIASLPDQSGNVMPPESESEEAEAVITDSAGAGD